MTTQNSFSFKVEGSGQFPLDMLHHDSCWPATSEDAALLLRTDRRTVELRTSHRVTAPRWFSFGWTVVIG